jgi:hypothetical protein
MSDSFTSNKKEIIALKVHQWLKEWDKVRFNEDEYRHTPMPHFYQFSLPAKDLRLLSGIYRRSTEKILKRSKDTGIQRRHDEKRSSEIHEFIQYGYPFCELSSSKKDSGSYEELRMPGWLPTAIVVNILNKGDIRPNGIIGDNDLIKISDDDDKISKICLPNNFHEDDWEPESIYPIEVIDGQHRLWAFEKSSLKGNFDLPVVAFHGLDIGWQAYLFWIINIKPKRINASLAFDLYPLLRTVEWLEKFEGHSIYRESRSQEITETLWSNPDSPWYQRINMLGETDQKGRVVTQASWIRSLMATYIRRWEGPGIKIGGLFSAPVSSSKDVLNWNRTQQVAFLILLGQKINEAIKKSDAEWIVNLRSFEKIPQLKNLKLDPIFTSSSTLFNTDQGIRALLHVTNDLCFVSAKSLNLKEWQFETFSETIDNKEVSDAIEDLKTQEISKYFDSVAKILINFDWRTSNAPGLNEDQKFNKSAFRGGSGYKLLRLELLKHLAKDNSTFGETANMILNALGKS